MICPICSSKDIVAFCKLYDDRYGYPGYFDLLQCKKCEHKFLDVILSPEQITELYTNYYPRSSFKLEDYKPYQEVKGFTAWFNGEFSAPFRWVPPSVRVLDIGCGFGETLGFFQARGCEAYGVEADENIRRVVDKFGYNVEVGLFDPQKYQQDFFDYVTMGQVIEHVTNPLATIAGIARILKKGGIAILSTPNSNGWGAKMYGPKWLNWHAPYHCQFFSLKSLSIAIANTGLALERLKTLTHSEWLYYQWLHSAFYPAMGAPSLFWSHKVFEEKSYYRKIKTKQINLFHFMKVNHMVTRLLDKTGSGDNYLFFLRKK